MAIKRFSKFSLNNRGDTIVEVLISMAILGLVLASAFAIANRSYAIGLSAQERTEALKIAESQIELLRLISGRVDDGLLDRDPAETNNLFCLDDSGVEIARVSFGGAATSPDTGNSVDSSIFPSRCRVGSDFRYLVSIFQSADVDSRGVVQDGKIYSVRVDWESINGNIYNTVNHEYRTYNFEESFSLTSPLGKCSTPGATNLGSPAPCAFPSETCQNSAATNFNISFPCILPVSPSSIKFIVKKIPPAAGNNTPNCSAVASLVRSGTTLNLSGTQKITDSQASATFNNLNANTQYNASVTGVPVDHELCPPANTTVTTPGPGDTSTNTTFKIRPICSLQITAYNIETYRRGKRRSDLDGWLTAVGYPGWDTAFYGPHETDQSRYFMYVFSGSVSGPNAYYYLYELDTVPGSPIYGMVCPPNSNNESNSVDGG